MLFSLIHFRFGIIIMDPLPAADDAPHQLYDYHDNIIATNSKTDQTVETAVPALGLSLHQVIYGFSPGSLIHVIIIVLLFTAVHQVDFKVLVFSSFETSSPHCT